MVACSVGMQLRLGRLYAAQFVDTGIPAFSLPGFFRLLAGLKL